MAVGWIDNIWNNSQNQWRFGSNDDQHNGKLTCEGVSWNLEQGALILDRGRHYQADWCGIPWYYQGKHFKGLWYEQPPTKNTSFYTSENEGRNWIVFEDALTGRQIARQSVPKDSDFHCNFRIENDGFFIDVVNNNSFSGENVLYQIANAQWEWFKVAGPILAEVIGKL